MAKVSELRKSTGKVSVSRPSQGLPVPAGPPAPEAHPPCLCGAPVVQRSNEMANDWRVRQTCGNPKCYRELLAIRSTKNQEHLGDHPACIICPEPVARRPGERRSVWFERKTCGPRCLSLLRAKQMSERNTQWGRLSRAETLEYAHPHCAAPGCTCPIVIREGEKAHHWRKRKACSVECRNRLRRRPRKPGREAQKAALPRTKKAAPPPKRAVYRPPATHPLRQFRRALTSGWAAAVRFETVEEAVARGVKIQKIKIPPAPEHGIPVRPKARSFSNGRV